MLLTNLLATLAVFASATTAVATPRHRRDNNKCKPDKPKNQRKAWHTLSNKEKKDYIDAELCLMSKPATLGLPGATNRFEEMQSIHQAQGAIIHNVVRIPWCNLFGNSSLILFLFRAAFSRITDTTSTPTRSCSRMNADTRGCSRK